MKKTISVLLALLLTMSFCFALSACGDKKNNEENTEVKSDDTPSVILKASADKAAPGDEIKIILNVSNVEFFASANFSVNEPENTEYGKTSVILKEEKKEELYSDKSFADGKVNFAAYVATTINFADEDIYEITYKISDDAESGTKITFIPEVSSFEVGTDESGNNTEKIKDKVKTVPVTVTVA